MGLAELAAGADRVLFVDAHVDEAETVIVPVSGAGRFGVTSHVLSPDTVLELSERCFGHRPDAWRCSVRGERWDFAAELTPVVQARCDALADVIEAHLFAAEGLPCTS
jgi:hypothetical protein